MHTASLKRVLIILVPKKMIILTLCFECVYAKNTSISGSQNTVFCLINRFLCDVYYQELIFFEKYFTPDSEHNLKTVGYYMQVSTVSHQTIVSAAKIQGINYIKSERP